MPTTANTIQKGNSPSVITDSSILDSGTLVTVGNALTVTGNSTLESTLNVTGLSTLNGGVTASAPVTAGAFFDTGVTGTAKGITLPQTASSPSSVSACKFWWDVASNVTGVSSGGNVTGTGLPTQLGGFTVSAVENDSQYPVFYNDATSPNGKAYCRFAYAGPAPRFDTNFLISSFTGLNQKFAIIKVMRVVSYNATTYHNYGGFYDSASPNNYIGLQGYGNLTNPVAGFYGGWNNSAGNVIYLDTAPPIPWTGFAVCVLYNDGTNLNLRVNGYTCNSAPVGTYTIASTVPYRIGDMSASGLPNNGGNVDIAAEVIMDDTLTLATLEAVENGLMQEFGYGSQQPILCNPNQSVMRNLVVLGQAASLTAAPGSTCMNPAPMMCDYGPGIGSPVNYASQAALSVWGGFRAIGNNDIEHNFTASTYGNVLSIWESSGSGFSAIVPHYPGIGAQGSSYTGGLAAGGIGATNIGSYPWGSTYTGSMFIEAYNGTTGATYPAGDFRLVQTSSDAYSAVLRHTINSETRAIVDLDTSYSIAVGSGGAATVTITASGGIITSVTASPPDGGTGYPASTCFPLRVEGGVGGIVLAYTNSSGVITSYNTTPLAGGTSGYTSTTEATTNMVDKVAGLPWQGLMTLRGVPATLLANSGSTLVLQIPSSAVGILIVKDLTNSLSFFQAIAFGSPVGTAIHADTEFSTTINTSSKLNVYCTTNGQWTLQNNLAEAVCVTAGFYGA